MPVAPEKNEDQAARDAAFLDVYHALIKRWYEISLTGLEKEMATYPTLDLFEKAVIRAKFEKKFEFLSNSHRIFERRYGDDRGKIRLIEEVFGEQLGLKGSVVPQDIKARLNWYRNRAASDFERGVRDQFRTHQITSPIEQIFLMEWNFQRVSERHGVILTPQKAIVTDAYPCTVDFHVGKPGTNLNIAIELDGHDFHEKTKAQVTRDKARDRSLARARQIMLRFSGSEIVRAPHDAVEEVVRMIEACTGYGAGVHEPLF